MICVKKIFLAGIRFMLVQSSSCFNYMNSNYSLHRCFDGILAFNISKIFLTSLILLCFLFWNRQGTNIISSCLILGTCKPWQSTSKPAQFQPFQQTWLPYLVRCELAPTSWHVRYFRARNGPSHVFSGSCLKETSLCCSGTKLGDNH